MDMLDQDRIITRVQTRQEETEEKDGRRREHDKRLLQVWVN